MSPTIYEAIHTIVDECDCIEETIERLKDIEARRGKELDYRQMFRILKMYTKLNEEKRNDKVEEQHPLHSDLDDSGDLLPVHRGSSISG